MGSLDGSPPDPAALLTPTLAGGLEIVAVRALGDVEDARDAVQETLSRALAAIRGNRVSPGTPLEAFVYGIAHHVIADVHRRRGRERGFRIEQGALIGRSDLTPPVLDFVDLAPVTVDASGGPTAVQVMLRLHDDLSGVQHVHAFFTSPSGRQGAACGITPDGAPLTVDASCLALVPQFAESGEWRLSLQTYDVVGNLINYSEEQLQGLGFRTRFTVTSAGDLTPPVLDFVDLAPVVVDVGGSPATVQVTFRLRDDLSGVQHVHAFFTSPSGQQGTACGFTPEGAPLTVEASCLALVPQFSGSGEWRLSLQMYDVVGNLVNYSEEQLVALGFNTRLTVTTGP